jgi:putative ATP-binding cassette transporter
VSGKVLAVLNRDVWTIFDKIFTLVTAIGLLLIPVVLITKKRFALIIFDIILIILLVLVLILFPMIFGAGMKEIVFTWAPWSLAGGIFIIVADIVESTVKILIVNK